MDFECISNETLNEKLYFITHKSGLKIYLLPKNFSNTYAIIATHFGSADDKYIADDGRVELPDGIAHFLEHKLFEKSSGGNAFDDYAATGASANAYTGFNSTAYLFSCTDKPAENLEILLSFVSDPYFTDENVNKEQGIITQEIRMYDDSAGWNVYFNLLRAMYASYPINKDIAGTAESILEIDKEILYKCYNDFYNPSNMILFIAGDVSDKEKILSIVDKHITAPKKQLPERIKPVEQADVKERYVEQSLSISAPIFNIGFKDNDNGFDGNVLFKKQITTEILLEMLFGKSSEIYNELYDSGLIDDSFSTEYSFDKDYAHSIIGGESPDPVKVKDKIADYLHNISLSEDNFVRAKNVITGRFLKTFNNIERIGNEFIANLFLNINLLDFIEIKDSISFDDIKNRFNKHFSTDYMSLSVVKPL